MIKAYSEKQRTYTKSGIITAFYSACFSRVNHLSGKVLHEVLDTIDKGSSKEEMKDEEMFAVVKRMSASFGAGE